MEKLRAQLEESFRSIPNSILKRIQEWLEGPYDEAIKKEIREQLINSPETLQDAFFKDLSFGTGGLRAKMGIGTNRLNEYTIRKATQGLANYLHRLFPSKKSVCIGYDVRHRSKEFALEAARVLAGNDISVLFIKEICPTPLLSFACRHFQCQAAIMITASHNPPEYNGYKVYWSDGGQVVAPHDLGILQEVQSIQDLSQVQISDEKSDLIQEVDESLDRAYLDILSTYRLHDDLPPLHVIYTPLHGTGIRLLPKALSDRQFSCSLVEKQQYPDGQFPHAPSVNPEEIAALELGVQTLIDKQADLLLGTDPDADRVGAAVLHQAKPVFLTGNQIASLCLYHICESLQRANKFPVHSICIKTIVTTELFKKIAESYGASCIDVLTGFKYIAAEINRLEKGSSPNHYLFGGEESYGYLFGSFVRDKDAISSGCLLAEAAAKAKQEGLTLLDRLHQLYSLYGIHRENLAHICLPDSQEGVDSVRYLMNSLRKEPPSHIHSQPVVQIDDYLLSQSLDLKTHSAKPISLPTSDVLTFWLQDRTKLVIRPSGTEPKIKIYAEIFSKPPIPWDPKSIESCDDRLSDLMQSFKDSALERLLTESVSVDFSV